MKKMLATLALLTVSTFAAAQSTPTNVDCDQVIVSENKGFVYRTKAVFPNPSELKSVYINGNAPITLCGITAQRVGEGVVTFSAKNFDTLRKGLNYHFYKDGYFNVEFFGKSGWEYPSIQAGFWSERISLQINVKTGEVTKFVKGDDFLFRRNTIGYKINGGPIKPVLFDGKFAPFKFDPKTIQTLEFFAINTDDIDTKAPERVLIDFKNAKFTTWEKHEFPAK